jgi:hypothetical protein
MTKSTKRVSGVEAFRYRLVREKKKQQRQKAAKRARNFLSLLLLFAFAVSSKISAPDK